MEDETLVRMFMTDFLDEAGFKVFEAAHADEALVVLEARPDVQAVVTDIEMPAGSMNGLELARVVRERWPDVGVVVTSGRARPDPDDLSDRVAFFAKPYRLDTIINTVHKWPWLRRLSGRRLTRETDTDQGETSDQEIVGRTLAGAALTPPPTQRSRPVQTGGAEWPLKSWVCIVAHPLCPCRQA